MYKYKLYITYDGTNYGGWQIQSNATAIQTLIENALKIITRHPIFIVGSGRTDAGVHALGQVAHFESPEELDPYRLLASLNGLLPEDIRILEIQDAAPDFHARYSAKGKIYHYHLHLDRILNPFKRLYSYHVLHKVDLPLLKETCKLFIGTHDFTSFANEATEGSAAKNPVRTISRVQVVEEDGGVRLEFEGDGFLYKMVRNIAGTLLDVSYGKIPIEDIPSIFAAKDRRKAGKAAPAHGLFLVKVHYP
jgi:tRNA pseudouridine38-40 synthase